MTLAWQVVPSGPESDQKQPKSHPEQPKSRREQPKSSPRAAQEPPRAVQLLPKSLRAAQERLPTKSRQEWAKSRHEPARVAPPLIRDNGTTKQRRLQVRSHKLSKGISKQLCSKPLYSDPTCFVHGMHGVHASIYIYLLYIL